MPQVQNHLPWDDQTCNWNQIYRSHSLHSTEEAREFVTGVPTHNSKKISYSLTYTINHKKLYSLFNYLTQWLSRTLRVLHCTCGPSNSINLKNTPKSKRYVSKSKESQIYSKYPIVHTFKSNPLNLV